MTYTEQLNEMEAEIMRLGALRNHQVEDSDNWWSYQHRITELTNRILALEASVPQLEAADREIRYADWIVQQAQQRADHDMDLLWRVAKVFGLAGLLGLVISVLWVPTIWLPIFAGVFITTAIATVVYGTKIRPARYRAVDKAQAALDIVIARREALDAQLDRGEPGARPCGSSAAPPGRHLAPSGTPHHPNQA